MSAKILSFRLPRKYSVMDAAQVADDFHRHHRCPVCGGRYFLLSKDEVQALRVMRDPDMCVISRLAYEGDLAAKAVLIEYLSRQGLPRMYCDDPEEAS